MASGEDASDVNNGCTPSEIPSQSNGQNMWDSEIGRPHRGPVGVGRMFNYPQHSSLHPQRVRYEALQLEFQDSQLSPALPLLPSVDTSHLLSESILFQQTDAEFVPLRGFPDLSVLSERCQMTGESHLHDHATLSEHPLELSTILSEEEKSCGSLSQHSIRDQVSYGANHNINRYMEGEEQTAAQRRSEGMLTRPKVQFRERDESMDRASSASESVHQKHRKCPPVNLQAGREQPQGGSVSLSSSFQKATAPLSDVSNITFRDSHLRSPQTSDNLSTTSASASATSNHGRKSFQSAQFITPSEGAIHNPHLPRELLNSAHLIPADGSYLSSQPVFQSTPAVPFLRPPFKHSIQDRGVSADAPTQLMLTETERLNLSNQPFSPVNPETTHTPLSEDAKSEQTHSHPCAISSKHTPTATEKSHSDTQLFYSAMENKDHVHRSALGRVQSLPSLSYLQKVDAWKANQSSNSSFYDNLSPRGGDDDDGSRKKQTLEAQPGSLMQPLPQPTSANNSSQYLQPGRASLHRVDVGAGLGRRKTSAESAINRSHSHSSLSSVVTSIQRDVDSRSQQRPAGQSEEIQSSLLSDGRASTPHQNQSSVKKTSPVLTLGHFSDVSSSFNMSNSVASSQSSCQVEQSLQASVGAASSAVSLEVDLYAPHWSSRPASPPHTRELNIEDRIPLYLLNLGIDQSPSTILNPFTRRGPIREPEFSPTDLCTIKGSIGTKSTQPSEVDSLQKETFSSSSEHSSSVSVTRHPSVLEKGQPAFDRSVKRKSTQTDSAPSLSTVHSSSTLKQSGSPQSDGSFGLQVQLSSESTPRPGTREGVKEEEDSLVRSGTLHEIRRLLGRAESLVSGRSSLTSSPGSLRLTESDTSLLSHGRGYTSLSAAGNLSLLRSSSDSALKGTVSSSCGPKQSQPTTTKATALSLKSRDLCVTPRRAEPEGCSAADPDKAKPFTATSGMQINAPPSAVNLPPKPEDDAIGSSENNSQVSAEAGCLSDSSYESSLAARVARLLQSESSVSMVTSRPSTADPEDSRARVPYSRDPRYDKWSSDSEGSAQSSVGLDPQLSQVCVSLRNLENLNSEPLQNVSPKPLEMVQDLEVRVQQIALRERFIHQTVTSTSEPTSITCSSEIENMISDNGERQSQVGLQPDAQPDMCDGRKETDREDITNEDKESETTNECQSQVDHTGIPSSAASGSAENTLLSNVPTRLQIESGKSKDVSILGHLSRISTSNLSSSSENRKPVQGQNAGGFGVHSQTRHPEFSALFQRPDGTSRTLTLPAALNRAVVPTLLPYKPHGSSELFYVPQVDPELSQSGSETTKESSHPGSDDAFPPHFSVDVLGSRELEERLIIPKHKEGIYSKRNKMSGASAVSRNPLPLSLDTLSEQRKKRVSSRKNMEFVETELESKEEENFAPLRVELDFSTDDVLLLSSTMQEPKVALEPKYLPSQVIRKPAMGSKNPSRTPHDVSLEITSSLNQLWHRFNEKMNMDETQPISDRETSLIDRLERLSRLIHSTTPTNQTTQLPGSKLEHVHSLEETSEKHEQEEVVQTEADPRQACPEREESRARGALLCPAERDESVSGSSLSTVDTERLRRAFGPRFTSKGQKNKEGMHKTSRRKPSFKHVAVTTDSLSTDDSTVSPESSSGTSFHQNKASYSISSKKPKVKLVSKSVQAGDLEIVINGTRRHTRDVGTIFPSPGAFNRGIPVPNVSSSTTTQTLTSPKRDTGNKTLCTRYPSGMTWFVSADELKSCKENQPQRESEAAQSQAWFEPYSRIQPWRESSREPLRERQNQPERERRTESSDKSSALIQITLQEALELHRPEFVSRSRERMKRLGLLVEERRIQAVFSRERDELFNYPAASCAHRTARKRVVSRKEMVQRSREKYARLPEVQKRVLEERRRAEYRSYRLNALLFNKKVTNRVLGKRTAWQ
ncbi:hypothetical protein DNTS_032745 [Danionella cerebrum]|uniref:ALMS motif domain-containing protein n=1 Tax=Danionella cerebrum TaxID=2873325 RepID=A0A553NW29_9TELE|nr:hypothetical protein DNTS_032745 [Danionella translucida]